MNTEEMITKFTEALATLEQNSDWMPLAKLYAESAVVFNPVLPDGVRGRKGVQGFWREYRDAFEDVKSHFRRQLSCGNVAVLEWYSEGHLAGSKEAFHYSGVSIFEHNGQEITEFKVYYDSAHLTGSAMKNRPGIGLQSRPPEGMP